MWQYTDGVRGFIVAYRTVFAPSGLMNPVGKEQSRRLIRLAELCAEKYGYGEYDCGNMQTGDINKDNVSKLYISALKDPSLRFV